mmetsp:Transcript_6776/g.17358  ORF Transcript_6776/g.17358 Transcript_6776/m.17358 type:complete len:317 (+) Transcript_6776:390-1340(+)
MTSGCSSRYSVMAAHSRFTSSMLSASMHRVWSKYLARARDRLTSPVACEFSTLLLMVCGVLPVPVRVSSVVFVAPMPITVPCTGPALMVSPTLNVGLVSMISPAKRSATTSLSPRPTATLPNPSRPHTAVSVTPTESRSSNSMGMLTAVLIVLAPVTMRGSNARAPFPTESTAAMRRLRELLMAVSRNAQAATTYTGHGRRMAATMQPCLANIIEWMMSEAPEMTSTRAMTVVRMTACSGSTAALTMLVSHDTSSRALRFSTAPSCASCTLKARTGMKFPAGSLVDAKESIHSHSFRATTGRHVANNTSTAATPYW